MTLAATSGAISLNGRLAVVTGGASGIGAACAQRLAEAGATILIADRDLAAARAVASPLGGSAIEVDLASSDFDADLVGGRADILVNCAGLQHVAPVHDFPPERFRQMVSVMLEAPFRLIRAASTVSHRTRSARATSAPRWSRRR